MGKIYDNWGMLGEAVLRREHDRQLAMCHSTDHSIISDDDNNDSSPLDPAPQATSFLGKAGIAGLDTLGSRMTNINSGYFVLQGLESASNCVEDMDEWLGIFNVKLRHMREDIESYAACLTGGSFDEARMLQNIEACEWLANALRNLEAPKLDRCYVNMKSVRETRAELDKLRNTFVKRASEFLRNYFASLVDFMISDKSYFSQRGQLKRPDHADLRYKCRTYARLLQHLKVLALRAVLKEQMAKMHISTGYTEVSGEETVESTSIPSSEKPRVTNNTVHQIGDCNYAINRVK